MCSVLYVSKCLWGVVWCLEEQGGNQGDTEETTVKIKVTDNAGHRDGVTSPRILDLLRNQNQQELLTY